MQEELNFIAEISCWLVFIYNFDLLLFTYIIPIYYLVIYLLLFFSENVAGRYQNMPVLAGYIAAELMGYSQFHNTVHGSPIALDLQVRQT